MPRMPLTAPSHAGCYSSNNIPSYIYKDGPRGRVRTSPRAANRAEGDPRIPRRSRSASQRKMPECQYATGVKCHSGEVFSPPDNYLRTVDYAVTCGGSSPPPPFVSPPSSASSGCPAPADGSRYCRGRGSLSLIVRRAFVAQTQEAFCKVLRVEPEYLAIAQL